MHSRGVALDDVRYGARPNNSRRRSLPSHGTFQKYSTKNGSLSEENLATKTLALGSHRGEMAHEY
ncbi:MAG: hypothetical protein C0490_18160 [Marivirga sp.]|nr:hypothetical protein [Marivirga sp.]